MPLLDELDDDVRAIGAANYVTIRDGRLVGHNNDGKGVVKAIAKVAPLAGQRVVMLGAGGAGRAMAVEIAWAGAAHLTLVTRRESGSSPPIVNSPPGIHAMPGGDAAAAGAAGSCGGTGAASNGMASRSGCTSARAYGE